MGLAVLFEELVPVVPEGAVPHGTFVLCIAVKIRNAIGGKKRLGRPTFPCARLIGGSSSGRKLALVEVRRHVTIKSQIIVEAQFAITVQTHVIGLVGGYNSVLRLLR